jgi:H+/gluconate symporter-like permease
MDFSVVAIVISLIGLISFAYRGFSVIMMAPIMALFAAVLSGLAIMPGYTELFMGKAVTYIKSFFPVFMLGAIFGKVMEDTGLAKSIAKAIISGLGKEPAKAVASVVIASSILTYGGVSLFVVVFAVYPFASALFKEADYPKRLIPATIALGAFTATMDCLPGTPQIQNIIPTAYFGTNLYAAPLAGFLGAFIIYGVGGVYLVRCLKSAIAKGEGYGNHTLNEPEATEEVNEVNWIMACVPLIAVLVANFLITEMVHWDPAILEPFKQMKGVPLVVASVKNIASIWALVIALVIGIILALVIGHKKVTSVDALTKILNAGAIGSLLAIMNTASEVGYGNVISQLPGFQHIAHALINIHIGGTPLVSEAVSVTTLAGITGSASGGMAIALELMSKDWIAWGQQIGMGPEIMHRVASMASGGLDTLPHNGAIITLLAVCGLTHRQSYLNIFAITVLKTCTVFIIIIIYTVTGLH